MKAATAFASAWIVFSGVLLLPLPSQADDASREIEVAVQHVYVPREGYDDNDRVEVLVEGELPSPCFTLGKTYADRAPSGAVRVHQRALVRTRGACGTGDPIEAPVPFLSSVLVGQLPYGKYRVEFLDEDRQIRAREFSIGYSSTDAIDDFAYANVWDVSLEKRYSASEPVRIQIRGTFPKQCLDFSDEIPVRVLGDVVVVQPALKHGGVTGCAPVPRPYRRQISLGQLAPGHYLLDLRVRDGKGVYRTFDVVREP
jgi:hypothetical protein